MIAIRTLPILFAAQAVCWAIDDDLSEHRTIYEFSVKDADGMLVSMSKYRNNVVLIVNVASQCGLTHSNYQQLRELEEKYYERGLRVAAFPCNQFGGQEPNNEEKVKQFVLHTFDYQPELYGKIDVNGENADPLWAFLKEEQGGTLVNAIKWNFTKFLVDRHGRVVQRYAPTTEPLALEEDIERLLDQE